MDLNEDEPLRKGIQKDSEKEALKKSQQQRSKSPPFYSEIKQERQRQDRRQDDQRSNQRRDSGSDCRDHSDDQTNRPAVHLTSRAHSSRRSGASSISFLDHARKVSTESSELNSRMSGRELQTLNGFAHHGASH